MRRMKSFLKKESREILTERSYLITLVLQLFIVATVVQLIVGYVSLSYEPLRERPSRYRRLPVAVVGVDEELSSKFEGLTLRESSLEDAQRMLEEGSVFAVIYANESNISVIADADNVLSGVTLSTITGTIEKINQEDLAQREGLEFEVKEFFSSPVYAYPYESSVYEGVISSIIFPFIILLPMFVAMTTVADSIIGERKKKTLENLLASPLTNLELVAGKSLPAAFLCWLQALAWVAVIALQGVPVMNIWLLAVEIFLLSFIFVQISVFFSTIGRDLREVGLLNAFFGIAVTFTVLAPIRLSGQVNTFLPNAMLIRTGMNLVPYDVIEPIALLIVSSVTILLINLKTIKRLRK